MPLSPVRLKKGPRIPGFFPPPRVTLKGVDGSQGVLEARVVVGADGMGSRVSRSLGWAQHVRRPVKASFSFRLEGRRSGWDRGVLFLGGRRTLGLAPVSADGRQWNATLVLAGEGILLVGDAAGYYDPLTGQGMSGAIRGARIAAASILRELAGSDSRSDFRSYSRALHRLVAPSRRIQKLIEAVLVRPGLRTRMIRGLGALPGVADALIRVTGDISPLFPSYE